MRCAIIGGGLTGLAAANHLKELNRDVDVVLFEAGPRLGGLIGTDYLELAGVPGTFILERGADSIIREKPAVLQLIDRLGLSPDLITTQQAHRGAYVVSNRKLYRIPADFRALASSKVSTFWKMPFLPLRTKLRASLDFFPRTQTHPEEESVTGFVSRHLGQDFFERLVQPIVSGIYSGNPDRLSASATLGPWVTLERKHKSLIRAVRARTENESADGGGARYSLFVALAHGMQEIVDALEKRLRDKQVEIRCSDAISSVTPKNDGGFELVSSAGQICDADAVIMTTPAYRSAELVAGMSSEASTCLRAFNYASASIGTYLFPVADIDRPLDAFGIVVPRREQRVVMASTFSHVKYPGRAPAGYAILRAYAGDHVSNTMTKEAIDDAMQEELSEWLAIRSAPIYKSLSTYHKALPQYEIGHRARVVAAESALANWPRLRLAGIAYEGTGLSDAVLSGERAAKKILQEKFARQF